MHGLRIISTGLFFAAAIFAHLAAFGQARQAENAEWPENNSADGNSLEDRFHQFDRALQFLQDQLLTLQHDVTNDAGTAVPLARHKDPGFRAIFRMHADGTHVQLVSAAPGMIASADPAPSHDGRMVAFGSVPTPEAGLQSKLFVYAMTGPFKGRFRDYGFGKTPDWSPDDRQLAYSIFAGNQINARGGVWIMDADGSNRRWICEGDMPRWSPDGKSLLVHTSGENGQDTLTIADVATGKTHSMIDAPGWSAERFGGNWSPDGKRIAFIGGENDATHVALIDADSSIKILYTSHDPNQILGGPPAWSPDGKRLVFCMAANNGAGPRSWWKSFLYSIPTDATGNAEPTLLEGKQIGNINRGPAFSADGTMLYFSSERDPGQE